MALEFARTLPMSESISLDHGLAEGRIQQAGSPCWSFYIWTRTLRREPFLKLSHAGRDAGGRLCQPGSWRSFTAPQNERRHFAGIDVRRLLAGRAGWKPVLHLEPRC